jgi:hypothetical protein
MESLGWKGLRMTVYGYMYKRLVSQPVLLKTSSISMNDRRPEERQGASARNGAIILSSNGLFSSNLQNDFTKCVYQMPTEFKIQVVFKFALWHRM